MPKLDTVKYIGLLPTQVRFLNSKCKEVLYSGGFRSGKSRALCYACARAASKPNSNVLLVRSVLWDLKNSTLDILIGGKHPVLPVGSYQHNKIERRIKLNGGGIIHYNGLDQSERIRSTSYGTICIDEGSELTSKEYQEVFDRLSDAVTWYPNLRQMYIATNPSGQNHFLFRRFFTNANSEREVIFSNSLENFHLPQDYIRSSLKSKSGVDYEKYVLGQWCNAANQVYENFDRNKHANLVLERQGYDEYFLGVDYGFRDPFVILVIGRKGERLFLLEEVYKPGLLMNDMMGYINDFVVRYNPTIVYDPSAAQLAAQIENLGIRVEKANNDIGIGISRVRDLFEFRNGMCNLLIDPSCKNTIMELENYSYKEDSNSNVDKPLGINDHACDCLRYVVNHIEDRKHSSVNAIVYFGEDD